MKCINVTGIQSGMLLQRDVHTNLCSVTVSIDSTGTPTVSMGQLTYLHDHFYRLTGIPVGGPYKIQICDNVSSVSFDDLWVGDLWLLGGQSNMEGYGEIRESDRLYDQNPLTQIRAFYMDDHWAVARTRLHLQWTNADTPLAEKWLNMNHLALSDREKLTEDDAGVGPGLFIGKYLWETTGIPQGLIPCAFGGTCMDDWSPDNKTATSQYQSMLRRFKACGSNVRGMFWYQGESDYGWIRSKNFTEKMVRFISALRQDFSIPDLPFVQVQIGINQSYDHAQLDNMIAWAKFRQRQADLSQYISNLSTVSAANTYRFDFVHIDADSQEEIGKALAMEMLSLLGSPEQQCPKLHSIELQPMEGHLYKGQAAIVLTYDNVIGELTSYGQPYGYSVTLFDEIPFLSPYKGIRTIKLVANKVYIVTDYRYEQLDHAYVWYGAGCNTVCTIQDSAGRAPLAMGPIPVKA